MARRALDPKGPLPTMACYHAQQATEKQLIGYLVFRQVQFRPVHDLVYLVQLCTEQDPSFGALLQPGEVLGEYATRMRYSLDGEAEPDEERAREALELAERMVAFTRLRLP
jgi:HEPN domain-containing protein